MSERLLDRATWSRIAPYLDRALDLEPAEREVWLTELAQLQPGVAATVRELLTECAALEQSGFLENRPLALFDFPSLTGKKIGAYTIERLLGRGGMGEVWLASRHDGRFEGRCAIKVLDDAPPHSNLLERFRREGGLLARLTHPHIARLMDAGATDDGRQYLVLEYVDGERIDGYCETRGLRVEDRVRLFLDVIAAVAHAHANLIVHRDLKPSNVLVARDGGVKLLDFGIAKLLRDPSTADDASTRVEEVALTPEYAAPEQIAGAAPSTATDLYQLGMLLYVLLTGRHPLPPDISRADRYKAILDGELPRASDLASGSMRQKLRGDLDAVLAMAMRKDPEQRYPTAAALGEDLRRYLNGEPVSARRGGALYHTRKFIGRHRVAVLGTAVALVSLCATLVFALEQAREAARQRDQARLEAKRAAAQNRFMNLTMAQIGAPDQPITPRKILENSEKLLESHYGNDPAFAADTLVQIASRYMDLGEREREYAALVKAERIARTLPDPLVLVRVQCNTVATDIALGHLDRAEARLAEAQRALMRASNRTLGDEVDCLTASAFVSEARSKPLEAIRIAEEAVAALEAREADHGDRYTTLVSYLTVLYRLVDNIPKTFESARKHRLAEQAKYGPDTAGVLGSMHNEAVALYDLGEVRAAFAAETEVVNRYAASNSPSDIPPQVLRMYGTALLRLDRAQAALPWAEQDLANSMRVGETRSISTAHNRLALVLHTLHRDSEADAQLDVVDRAIKSDARPIPFVVARLALVRAQLLAARGDLHGARARVESVLVQTGDQGAGAALLAMEALLTASRIAAAEGRLGEAESYARDALRRSELRARDPAQSADVGEAALVLAQIGLRLDKHSEAQALASRAAISLRNSLGANHSLTRAALALLHNPDR